MKAVLATLRTLVAQERGSISVAITMMVGGVLLIVFGLSLAPTVISAVVTANGATGAGSFQNALSLNALFPFIYYTILIVGSIGLIAAGGWKVKSGD